MNSNHLKYLKKNLIKMTNEELNNITFDLLENKKTNRNVEKLKKLYNQEVIVNEINKINIKKFSGGEVNDKTEAAQLRNELDASREENKRLRQRIKQFEENKMDLKNLKIEEQRDAERNAKITRKTVKNEKLIVELKNKQAQLTKQIAEFNELKKRTEEAKKGT